MKLKNLKKQKKEKLEKYLSGVVLAFIWQTIFVKLILGQEWYLSATIGLMTAIIFFIVSVLIFETSELKGNI